MGTALFYSIFISLIIIMSAFSSAGHKRFLERIIKHFNRM